MAIQSIQKIQPDTFLTLINTFANGWDDLIELLRTIGIGALEAISLPSASTVVGGAALVVIISLAWPPLEVGESDEDIAEMKKQQEKEKQETDSSKDSSQPNKNNENTEVPNVKYPGDDPTVSPGEEWEWRGPEDKGSWYNPNTGETLHPDLNHPEPEGPHWDYIPYKNGPQYRILPDGSIIPK